MAVEKEMEQDTGGADGDEDLDSTESNQNRPPQLEDSTTERNSGGGEEIVYLFSSASRARYTEDIYNSLAYPPDHIIQFRYREPWWGRNIREKVENDSIADFKGMVAVVVAAPYPNLSQSEAVSKAKANETKYTFYPLRKGEIKDVSHKGDSLHFYLKLSSDLINYPSDFIEDDLPKFHNQIDAFDQRPVVGEEENEDDVFVCCNQEGQLDFVSTNSNGDGISEWPDNEFEAAWNRIVKQLSREDSFSETLFFRILSLNEISNGRSEPKPATELYSEKHVGYELSSSDQYSIVLSLDFAGNAPDFAQSSELSIITSEKIETLPDSIGLGFRTDEKELILDPNTGLDQLNTSLIIGSEADFWTPEIDIPLRVNPSSWRKYGPFAVLLGGILMVILSSMIIDIGNYMANEYANGWQIPVFTTATGELTIRLIGTAFSVFAMHLFGAYSSV